MVDDWLRTGMFKSLSGQAQDTAVQDVIDGLGDHALTLSHSRHISPDEARSLGLDVIDLESDQDLQDAVLAVHHSTTQSLSSTPSLKIIENHVGVAHITRGQAE